MSGCLSHQLCCCWLDSLWLDSLYFFDAGTRPQPLPLHLKVPSFHLEKGVLCGCRKGCAALFQCSGYFSSELVFWAWHNANYSQPVHLWRVGHTKDGGIVYSVLDFRLSGLGHTSSILGISPTQKGQWSLYFPKQTYSLHVLQVYQCCKYVHVVGSMTIVVTVPFE